MELIKILPILAFLSVAIVVSHAATMPSEEYWNSILPNTPMPKSLKDLLHPSSEWQESKNSAQVNVGGGKGGVGVNVRTHNKNGNPVNVHVSPFVYNYAATETQLHDDPNVALFFLEKDLYAGNKMNLHFSKTTNQETQFLPRQVADSIPFSSNKLPDIYSKLSVNPDSDEAGAMKKTIQECEDRGIKGEEKFCATSLESMIDFITSKLGKEVTAVSTDADSTERKVYRIKVVRKKPSEKAVVVCHEQEYAYAVFYCHKTDTTVAYEVSLVGAGGSKADAVAMCHQDTAEWNPKHLAFQVLKVKPGTLPICHYLPSASVEPCLVSAELWGKATSKRCFKFFFNSTIARNHGARVHSQENCMYKKKVERNTNGY